MREFRGLPCVRAKHCLSDIYIVTCISHQCFAPTLKIDKLRMLCSAFIKSKHGLESSPSTNELLFPIKSRCIFGDLPTQRDGIYLIPFNGMQDNNLDRRRTVIMIVIINNSAGPPVLDRRKPILLLLFDGVLLLRFATRTLFALLFQLPPRFTRFEP